MSSHRHTAQCWRSYESCGEHHAHDYSCGNGVLAPSCPMFVGQKRVHMCAELNEALARLVRARKLAAEANEAGAATAIDEITDRLRKIQK